MRWDRDALRAVVPQGLPPPELVDRERLQEIDRDRDQGIDEVVFRSALWTTALQNAFEKSGMWLRVHRYDFSSYGFVELDGEPRFGVTVHAEGTAAGVDIKGAVLGFLTVRELQFPVILNRQGRGRDHLYSYPPEHPSEGTAACWTLTRVPTGSTPRLLTAGHVFSGRSVGDSVDLTHGQLFSSDHLGTVAQFGPPRVDAALVEQDQACHAPFGQHLTIRRLVAPGTDAYFRGQGGGFTHTLVREVSNPRISVDKNYANVEFLVLLEDSGAGGDSGALVLADDGSDDVLALYVGEADDINGKDVYGRCQLMRQVQLCLDVDLMS
jgi:hypothetical protein